VCSRAITRTPENGAQAIDRDGWFHTGDIGSLDEYGTIMFHGRYKDMLKVGGENVAAAEIESLLSRHPAVKLAQVVGIPDAKYVEVPAAFVELKPGSATTTAEDLMLFCKSRYPRSKCRGWCASLRMAHVLQQDSEIQIAPGIGVRTRSRLKTPP
jgi:acyl-CoA synthetase (AMP-forming)/AMP-acid ligase II